MSEIQAEFQQVVDIIKNKDKYTNMGAELPRGLLLRKLAVIYPLIHSQYTNVNVVVVTDFVTATKNGRDVVPSFSRTAFAKCSLITVMIVKLDLTVNKILSETRDYNIGP